MNGIPLVKTGWLLVGVLLLVLLLHPHLRQALAWQFRLYSPSGAAYREYVLGKKLGGFDDWEYRKLLYHRLKNSPQSPEEQGALVFFLEWDDQAKQNELRRLVQTHPDNARLTAWLCNEIYLRRLSETDLTALDWHDPYDPSGFGPVPGRDYTQDLSQERLLLQMAEQGEKIDPDNAFFAFRASAVHAARGDFEEMHRAIGRAAQCDRFQDYNDVSVYMWQLFQRKYDSLTPFEIVALDRGQSYDVRATVRLASMDAGKMEAAGLVEQATSARQNLLRCNSLMRREETAFRQNTLYALNYFATARPGGDLPGKFPRKELFRLHSQYNHYAYARYLREQGYSDLAVALEKDWEVQQAQGEIRKVWAENVTRIIDELILLPILFGVFLGLFASAGLVCLGTTVISRSPMVKKGGPMPPGMITGLIIPVLLASLIGIAIKWKPLYRALNPLHIRTDDLWLIMAWVGIIVFWGGLIYLLFTALRVTDYNLMGNVFRGFICMTGLLFALLILPVVIALPGYLLTEGLNSLLWQGEDFQGLYLVVAIAGMILPAMLFVAFLYSQLHRSASKGALADFTGFLAPATLMLTFVFLVVAIFLGFRTYTAGSQLVDAIGYPGSSSIPAAVKLAGTPWPDEIYIPKPNTQDKTTRP